ncbi:MAG TPA: hypothetical protein GX708_20685 [Gallicola sp.]|nr:hypothetical protein [Gallicola sp.]
METSLTAAVLSIGKVNIQTGKTKYDWSVYDSSATIYYAGGMLLYGSSQLKIGDRLTLRNNDSNRLITHCEIIDSAPANKEAVIEMLLKHKYDYRPARPFKKKEFSKKLQTSYSIKGIKQNEE